MHLLACLLASIRPRTSPTKFQVSFPPRQFSFILISHRSIFIDANAKEVHGMFSSLHGVRHCFLDSLLLTELLERADLGRPETRRPYGMWNAQFIRGDWMPWWKVLIDCQVFNARKKKHSSERIVCWFAAGGIRWWLTTRRASSTERRRSSITRRWL